LDLPGNRMYRNSHEGDIGIRVKPRPSNHVAALGLSNTRSIKIITRHNPAPIPQGHT
jgi:hypothetical protein